MMHKLVNTMKVQSMLASGKVVSRIGTVSSYNPADYCAKVLIQPDGIETGWLPIASAYVGNGWGLFMPPQAGNVVVVLAVEGDIEAGVIMSQIFNDTERPVSTPAGEMYMVHSSGSALKFHATGGVDLIAHTDLNVTVGGNMTANVTGSMTANVTGAASITGSEVDLIGTGGTAKGIVQADCVCAFTGQPHPMVSSKVKGSL